MLWRLTTPDRYFDLGGVNKQSRLTLQRDLTSFMQLTRLLRPDPHAVPIAIPTSKHTMPFQPSRPHDPDFTERRVGPSRKLLSGSFRPYNTLGSRDNFTTSSRTYSGGYRSKRGLLVNSPDHKMNDSLVTGFRQPAATAVRGHSFERGPNGKRRRVMLDDGDDDIDQLIRSTESARKRRSDSLEGGSTKKRRPTPPPVISVPDDEDELSQPSARGPTRASSQNSQGRPAINGTRSQFSGRQNRSNHQTSEFQRVEDTMRSDHYGRPQCRNRGSERAASIAKSQGSDVQIIASKKVGSTTPRGSFQDGSARAPPADNDLEVLQEDVLDEQSIREIEPKKGEPHRHQPTATLTPATRSGRKSALLNDSPDELADEVISRGHRLIRARGDNLHNIRGPDEQSGSESTASFEPVECKMHCPVSRVVLKDKQYNDEGMALLLDLNDQISVFREEAEPELLLSAKRIVRMIYHDVAPRLIVRLVTSRSSGIGNMFDIEFRDSRGYKDFVKTVHDISNSTVQKKTPEFLAHATDRRVTGLPTANASDGSDRGRSPQGSKRLYGNADLGADSNSVETMSKRQRREQQSVLQTALENDTSTSKNPLRRGSSTIDDLLRRISDGNANANRIDELARSNRRQTRSRISNYFEDPKAEDETSIFGQIPESERYSKKYGLGKAWKHALVYPPTGKGKATVDFEDLERLDDGQFLNDNLIDFYLKYLQKEQMTAEAARSVHLFNTHFYTSLTKTDRGQKINYEAVKKWTRGIDLFSHDFVIVPINEMSHWYVAIICNLPALKRNAPSLGGDLEVEEVAQIGEKESAEVQPLEDDSVVEVPAPLESNGQNSTTAAKLAPNKTNDELDIPFSERAAAELKISEDEDAKETNKGALRHKAVENAKGRPPSSSPASARKKGKGPVYKLDPEEPAIITLDSLGQSHPATIRALKNYLMEEAKDKRGGMDIEASTIRSMNAKGIPLQQNFHDCGVYLLGYMDKFAENPYDFVTKVLQKEFDDEEDWPQLIPSEMRTNIRELVQKMHRLQESDKKEKKGQLPRASDARSPETLRKRLKEPAPGETGLESPPLDALTTHDAEKNPALAEQPSLEVPRTPDRPQTTVEAGDDGDELAESMIATQDPGANASRSSPVGRHNVVVPDSQEDSFHSQLTATAAADPENILNPIEQAAAPTFKRSPVRPKTRGKPEINSEAIEITATTQSQRETNAQRVGMKPHVLEVIDVDD